MARTIVVYGNADKSELAFPKPEDLLAYMKDGVFTDNGCRYRFSQTKDADIIVMSREGWAYGHFDVSSREEPTQEDREDYPPVKAVYIVDRSSLYSKKVKLTDVGIRGIQFGKRISENDFSEIISRAGVIKVFEPV